MKKIIPHHCTREAEHLPLAGTGLYIQREFLARVGTTQGKLLGVGHLLSGEFMPLVFECVIMRMQITSLIIWQFWNEGSGGHVQFVCPPQFIPGQKEYKE